MSWIDDLLGYRELINADGTPLPSRTKIELHESLIATDDPVQERTELGLNPAFFFNNVAMFKTLLQIDSGDWTGAPVHVENMDSSTWSHGSFIKMGDVFTFTATYIVTVVTGGAPSAFDISMNDLLSLGMGVVEPSGTVGTVGLDVSSGILTAADISTRIRVAFKLADTNITYLSISGQFRQATPAP